MAKAFIQHGKCINFLWDNEEKETDELEIERMGGVGDLNGSAGAEKGLFACLRLSGESRQWQWPNASLLLARDGENERRR
jgi:hypothetical protein